MANGRMHHHDKHAASKDGHRPDDPHGVTSPLTKQWKAEQLRFHEIDPHAEPTWQQQELSDLMNRQAAIQSVLDEPNIRREGHEVFNEGINYGQRVTAFGDIEREVADQQIEAWRERPRPDDWSGTRPVFESSEGYDDTGDQMDEELTTHPDDDTALYARKATFGQDYG